MPGEDFFAAGFVGDVQLDIAPGGDLLLTRLVYRLLFRRGTWKPVPFEDQPTSGRFVSPRLIAGHDDKNRFGVWIGDTGKRLAGWPREKTPGCDRTGHCGLPDGDAVAADPEVKVLVFGPLRDAFEQPTLYDLRSGKKLGQLPVIASGASGSLRGACSGPQRRARCRS